MGRARPTFTVRGSVKKDVQEIRLPGARLHSGINLKCPSRGAKRGPSKAGGGAARSTREHGVWGCWHKSHCTLPLWIGTQDTKSSAARLIFSLLTNQYVFAAAE